MALPDCTLAQHIARAGLQAPGGYEDGSMSIAQGLRQLQAQSLRHFQQWLPPPHWRGNGGMQY